MRIPLLAILVILKCIPAMKAQGTVFEILAGPTLSTETVEGFERDPFLRLHGLLSIETSSDISPNALYARLGYHIKGSAVNIASYYDSDNKEHPASSNNMEFHNLSFSLGVKQRIELGANHISYGFGVRGDYNLKAKYDYVFAGLTGTENSITYGVDVDAGFEFPLSELISCVIEIGVSPDLVEQIFIPMQDTGYNYPDGSPVIIHESKITNVVFEARAGFRFWHKVIYTD